MKQHPWTAALLLAGAVAMPMLARAETNQAGHWTMRAPAEATKIYINDSPVLVRIRLMVCFDRVEGLQTPARIVVNQSPPVERALEVGLGGCNSVSWSVPADSAVTLVADGLGPNATASGGYQIGTW